MSDRTPRPVLPVLAVVLAVAGALVVLVPALRFTGWTWAALAAGAVVSLGLAAPAHATAARSVGRRSLDAVVLGSVSALLGWAWTLVAVATGLGTPQVLGALVPGALLVVAEHARRHAAVDPGDLGVPAWVVGLAAAAAVVSGVAWALAAGLAVGGSVAAAVLIGSAPAAAALATPVALLAARGRASGSGVNLGSAAAARRAADVDTIVLQQDGTVTTGRLRVTEVSALEQDHERNLRWFAGALAHAGEHPISRAIAQLAGRGRVTGVEELTGQGMQGTVDRHPVRLGDPHWLGTEPRDDLWRTVAVEVDARLLGTLTVADEVREDAARGIEELHDLGLDVHLVSASSPARAQHVASACGVTQLHQTGLAAVVSSLPGRVAVAGDQAAGAQVWIAPGAESTGGIGVEDLGVRRVALAVRHARATTRAVARSRAVAVTAGALAAAAAAGGLLGPDLAAAASVATGLATYAVAQQR